MGISTVTAARIYKGQQTGKPGEESVLAWERFPHVALSKVKSVDVGLCFKQNTNLILKGIQCLVVVDY